MEQEDNNEQGNEGNEPSEHAEEQINIDKKDEDITKEREADESESEDEMGDQMENVILYIPTGKSTEIISKDQHEKLLKLDMYGFDLPDKSNEPDIYQAYLSNKAMVSQKIEKQRARWAKLLKTRKSALSEKDTKNSTLKQLFRFFFHHFFQKLQKFPNFHAKFQKRNSSRVQRRSLLSHLWCSRGKGTERRWLLQKSFDEKAIFELRK